MRRNFPYSNYIQEKCVIQHLYLSRPIWVAYVSTYIFVNPHGYQPAVVSMYMCLNLVMCRPKYLSILMADKLLLC